MTDADLARGQQLWSRADGGDESEKAEWHRWCDDNATDMLAAAEREAGLRDALEYYAWADHWTRDSPYDLPTMYGDKGARARRALGEGKR